MEEKKAEISAYLRSTVSPFITPLMEELAKTRPTDLLQFTKDYVCNLIGKLMIIQRREKIKQPFQTHKVTKTKMS